MPVNDLHIGFLCVENVNFVEILKLEQLYATERSTVKRHRRWSGIDGNPSAVRGNCELRRYHISACAVGSGAGTGYLKLEAREKSILAIED